MFPGEVEKRVRSWEGVFYFLSNERVEGIAKSQSEWAHGLLSVAWMDVSSFIHMAPSKRRKKALVLTLFEVYVEQGPLGLFWQWQIDYVDGSLFARGSRETFLWGSPIEGEFTKVFVWVDCNVVSPLNCETSRLPHQHTNVTSKNVFPRKYTPRFYSSGHWECVLKIDKNKCNIVLAIGFTLRYKCAN